MTSPCTSAAPATRLAGLALLCAAALTLPGGTAAQAQGASVADLEARVSGARQEAEALAAEIQARQAELAAAHEQALAASVREAQLSSMLAAGRSRARKLSGQVAAARERVGREKARLARARQALAQRLVAIYMAGEPDPAAVMLNSDGFDDLVARSGYLGSLEDADNALAARVEQVRRAVSRRLRAVARLRERVRTYNARLAAAHAQIASVRAAAESTAASLAAAVDARAAAISTLRTSIDGWVGEIQAARQAAAERVAEQQEAAAEAEAEAVEQVDRWLGGPYSIPAYIVMCESGGNYSALNPSSGAGGAYQIIPSTWEAYGGEGLPHEAPKDEQDAIAAQIWADSGGSAWVCAG